MTRYSDLVQSLFAALGVVACLNGPASAESFATDAFGVFSASTETPRNTWSGVQTVEDGKGGIQTRIVEPGPVEQLHAVNGSKSMVAGRQSAEFLVIALDAWGNAVADGTKVDFRIETAPDATFQTTWGIASYLYKPDPKSGLYRAGARSGNRQSARTEYRVNPDTDSATIPPLPIGALSVDGVALAKSASMQDAYGNQILDGTTMMLVVSATGGTYDLIPALVMQGKGIARFQTVTSDAASVHWELAAVRSTEVPVLVEPLVLEDVPEFQAQAVDGIAATNLMLGPFLTSTGYFLNDGTEMDLVVWRENQVLSRHRGWTVDGLARFVLPLTEQDLPVTITVSGRFGSFDVTLERNAPDEVTR